MTEENRFEDDIKAAVEARLAEEAEALKNEAKKDDDVITPEFIEECLAANEFGDGALYAALHRGRHIRNISLDEWYFWAEHYWEIDMKKLRARRAVNDVALKYLEGAESFEEEIQKALDDERPKRVLSLRKKQAAYRKRANKLRAVGGSENCTEWASAVKDGLAINDEEFDRDPMLIACKNGVIELTTGRFRAGRPEDYITKAVPHDWKGINEKAEEWEKFLYEVFEGNTELIDYLRRALGYCITGLSRENIFLVLHGEGRNGKSVFVETLRHVLGDIAKPIQSEMLLDQRHARASGAHSSDIMTLKGLRIAFASETDKHRRFSPSQVKRLSGGDSLNARPAHAPYETTFKPTHTLCLLTNHLPHAAGDDFAFWQRMNLVPFKLKFVDNPQAPNERKKDETLLARLELEAPGIFAWLVRGCIEYQREGLKPPLIVKAATEQYRLNEDVLAGFIEARCYPPEDIAQAPESRTSLKELYPVFKEWYVDFIGDERHCPRKKDFSETVGKRFKKENKGGQVWFYGICLDSCKKSDE